MKIIKIFAVLSAVIMTLVISETASFADEFEEETAFIEIMGDGNPDARYLYTAAVSANISLSGNTLICQSKLKGSSRITKINVNQCLEKKNGSAWKTLKSWSRTAKNSRISLTGCAGASSGTYRIRTVFRVYCGKKYETIVKYSDTRTFSLKKENIDDEYNFCMVTSDEINDLLNSVPSYEGKDVSLAEKFKAGGLSNIYKIDEAGCLYNYYTKGTGSLSSDDQAVYYTETDSQWCAYRKDIWIFGDDIIRIVGHVQPGYLTMMQYKEKTLELMKKTDEEILELKYYNDHLYQISCIYFKTESGEYVVPYHNKRYVEFKGIAESGRIYHAKEYAEALNKLRIATFNGKWMTIDETMEDETPAGTVISNPDGTDSIIYGDIDYDSIEVTGRGIIFQGDDDIINGDADGNGKLDVRDSSFIAKALAGKSKTILPDNADFNKDGSKNIRDAAAIAKYLAKK